MTDEYTRQGPQLQPVMDIQAVRLHWNHSVLQERDFLPEWKAQTHASDLAAELGYIDQLVVDVFALPLRHKSCSRTVTFEEEIVVYMGPADDITFHQVPIQHCTLSSWQGKPWTVRASSHTTHGQEAGDDDVASLMARRPHRPATAAEGTSSDHATSSSSTSSSVTHLSWRQTVLVFLNGQMLPARVPWNDGDAMAAHITQAAEVDLHELLGVHYVPNRPLDLIQQDLQCLLVQVRNDVRPSSFMRLVLIDLEIYEPNEILPGAFRRFSKWLPVTLNRVSAFRLLEVETLLIEYPDSSRLWHNHVPVPEGQAAPMHLNDGDFLKIVIGHHETCDNSNISSFSIESELDVTDDFSTFQLPEQKPAFQPSLTDVDPLSIQAVCISGNCGQFSCQPRVHSMNEPFSFFPDHADTPERTHPGRPPRVESPIWHHEIWDLLCDEGATEMEEEGPIIYVNSFFISHVHTPSNRVSRPLRFDAEHETWEASARFMWEDFVDPHAPIDIIVVRPDPPVTIYEGTVATVIVEQHPLPQKVVAVVSAVPDSPEIRHARHVAFSSDMTVNQNLLIEVADVQAICNVPGCTTWIGARRMHETADIRVHAGLGLQIKIPADRLDASRSSTEIVIAAPPTVPAATISDAEEDQEDIMLLSLSTEYLQESLSRTMRLLNGDTATSCQGNYELPFNDFHGRNGATFQDERHLDDLYETWQQATAIFAASVEESAVSFTSWYVHGTLWTACDQPRDLMLYPQRSEWDSQIRTLWRDKIQPGQSFEVTIISPSVEPENFHRHVLIHQGLSGRHKGILLSTFFHADASHLHTRAAYVVPRRIDFQDLTRLAGHQLDCRNRALLCVGFLGSDSLDEDRPLFPSLGMHFELHLVDWEVVPQALQPTRDADQVEDTEISSLVHAACQINAPTVRRCGIDLPSQPHESQPFQFQASAPVFVPGIPWDLHAYDEFIQDLFEAWNQLAVGQTPEARSCYILVWFVDHQWPHPHGYVPRRIRLYPNLQDWRTQIWQAYQELIVPGQELEYNLVTPHPYTVDRSIAAHVIVIQRPHEQWVTNIVTLFDERTMETTVKQMAITTHEHILLDNLVRVLGYYEECFGAAPELLCNAWYRDLALVAGAPIPGISGLSINVLARPRRRQMQQSTSEETDATGLLTLTSFGGPWKHLVHPLNSAAHTDEEEVCPHLKAIRDMRIHDHEGTFPSAHSQEHSQRLTPVPIPAAGIAPIGLPNFVSDMMNELQPHMMRMDGGQQGFVIRVWYLHHTHLRVARIARYLHLSGPPHVWQPRIVALWSDRLTPFEAIAIHLVKPTPHRTRHEQTIAFDVIVSQGVHEQRRSGLISVFPSPADSSFPQFAVAASLRIHVSGAGLIQKLGFQQVCQLHRCLIFHRWTEIPHTPAHVHLMSNGDGFEFHVHRNELEPVVQLLQQPAQQGAPIVLPTNTQPQQQGEEGQETEGPVLLQLHALLQRGEVPDTNIESETPLRVIGVGDLHDQVPTYVSITGDVTLVKVQQELACFGHSGMIELAANRTLAICIPEPWPYEEGKLLVLFTDIQQTFPGDDSAFLTLTDQLDVNEIQLMALLHKFGYEKAVIVEVRHINVVFIEITFQQAGGTLETEPAVNREQKPWPVHPLGDRTKHRPLWQERSSVRTVSCLLDLGLSTEELLSFFHCDHDYLCQVTEGLPLLQVTQDAISELKQHTVFDRLIVYVDGSSQSKHKHVAPALNEEIDVPDAWCFVVLGETRINSSTFEYTLLGWQAHQVRYDNKHPWYIGATHVGSAIAEREALVWAFIWRLGFDSCLPTVFRSDSLLAVGQADGTVGTAVCDQSFQTLRGCYQALQAALGDDVALDHVYGHLNDPWNEMTDVVAKQEAKSSFFLSRPDIDIPRLLPKIPFLWMMFENKHGLPSFTGLGFDVCPPALPQTLPDSTDDPVVAPTTKAVQFKVSIATANVQSLGSVDQGFAGKLDYLRAQVSTMHLNFLGVQEARSSEGTSLKQGILRFCSGGLNGKWGVEFWVNLQQPFAHIRKTAIFFRKQDFHVAYRDPRRILVHIRNDHFSSWCMVAHAPQSGIAMRERQNWWEETRDILHRNLIEGDQLFMCLDANAGPGVPDGTCVFQPGFRQSSGTPLLRDFLDEFELCLPITSDVHVGTTTTWTSPDDGEYTIDYVAIPRTWKNACLHSEVLTDFDLANVNLDHSAVALDLQWTAISCVSSCTRTANQAFNRTHITKEVEPLLCHSINADWHENVESHANKIAGHFRTQLAKKYPKTSAGPKKPYVSEFLWKLRSRKIALRNSLRMCRSLLRREALARIFQAWKHPTDPSDAAELSFNYGTTLRVGCLHRYIEFAAVSTQLRKDIQQCRQKKLQEVLSQIDHATPASKIQQMLKPFKGPSNRLRQGMAPLPLIKDQKGHFCRTAEDALQRWITFFGEMEGGTSASHTDQWTRWRQNLQFFLQTDLVIPVEEIPTLCDLEHACRQSAAGKATGLDAIPSEVCRFCPRATALQLYSLMLKTCTHGQEALAHKGGLLLPIWKGKQLKDQCSAFRSILLSSCLGKVMHKAVRTKQLDLYQQFLHQQQLGGRKGVPVTLGGHQVRAFQRLCVRKGQPSALLFIDLQEAFYRVLRPLVVDGPIDDASIAAMADRIDLNEGFLHDLHAALQQPCALAEAGIPSHLSRAIRALHTDTYFKLPLQKDQVVTQIGTRPGDSFADVIFGFLMAKVLHKFERAMQMEGHLLMVTKDRTISLAPDHAPAEELVSFVGPCWMDDLCVCLTETTNERLHSALGIATGVILDIFKGYAMTPNLQPGKTAIIFSPRGPGTNQWKRKNFGPEATGHFLSLGEHHAYQVPLVTEYTHLGGKVHFSSKLRKEVRHRLGQAHQEFNKHRKLLYQNKHFQMDKKKELFQSLILSRLLFGAETWTFSDQKTKDYLHGSIMGLLKRLLRCPGNCPISDEEILHRTKMPSPSTMLRVCRLRYLGSLFAVGDTACWGLLNQDQEWLTLVKDDFRWLWFQLQHCCKLGDPEIHLARWLEIIQHHRGYWRRLVRRATEHSIGVQSREYLVVTSHIRFLDCLEEGNFVRQAPSDPTPDIHSEHAYGCMFCQKSCRSLGGEGAHMHRAHGETHPVRHLMGSTQCAACLTEYFTMGKLKMHLIRSAPCRTTLLGRGHREAVQPGLGSAEDMERWARWDNKLPPLTAEGPHLPAAPGRDFDVEHQELYEEIVLGILEVDTADYEAFVRRSVSKHPISWTRCRQTLEEAQRQCAGGFLDVDPPHMQFCMQVLNRLSQASAWPFLMHQHRAKDTSVPSIDEVDRRIEAIQINHVSHSVPRQLGKERVFLHAFSGRRRAGDLQHYLEAAFGRQADGMLLHVVSMDVVIDKEWGDACRSETRDFWLRGALSGFVQGGLCGPPCETWSQARFVDIADDPGQLERQPRPLRSLEWLWGLPSMSLRELGQVAVGNELLLFSIDLMICLARSEGLGVLEHPGEPADEEKPSIWRLPIINLLRQLPGFMFVDFAQGLLGAKSPKPTRFLTLNMASLPGFLHQHRLCPDLPRASAIGKMANGQWATTSLKEYPPALNRALGESFAYHLLQSHEAKDSVIDEVFLNRCRSMHVDVFGEHYGPDYCEQRRKKSKGG